MCAKSMYSIHSSKSVHMLEHTHHTSTRFRRPYRPFYGWKQSSNWRYDFIVANVKGFRPGRSPMARFSITTHLSFVTIHTFHVICFTVINFILHHSFVCQSLHTQNWPVQQMLFIAYLAHRTDFVDFLTIFSDFLYSSALF